MVRQFKIEKVIAKSDSEKRELLGVRVPLDLINKDEFTYKEAVVVRNGLEAKIREINRAKTLSEAEWAKMTQLKEQVSLENYIVLVLGLEQKLNYDFSLGPTTRYFFAVHKGSENKPLINQRLEASILKSKQ